MKGLLCGVGINDANYSVLIRNEDGTTTSCHFHSIWSSMINRCYNKNRGRTYSEATVCKEWLTFSKFKEWMISQPFSGMQLDKDIILSGNKHYSPELCCFVPHRINSLLCDCGAKRGDNPLGVYYVKKSTSMKNELSKPYKGQVRDGEGNRIGSKGCLTALEAHRFWQIEKSKIIYKTINWWASDKNVKHSFNSIAAESLAKRAWDLLLFADTGKETKIL